MSNLIGRVVLQPTVVRPGEPVRVEVLDLQDNPFGTGADISINGVPGALQILQFPTAGQRRLTVCVRTAAGETDRQTVLLDVQGPPVEFPSTKGQKDLAIIGVTQLSTQPYTAVLTLGSTIDVRSPVLLSTGPSVSPQFGKVFDAKSAATRLMNRGALGRAMLENSQALTRVETRRLVNTRAERAPKVAASVQGAEKNSPKVAVGAVYDLTKLDFATIVGQTIREIPQEYEWDFGDGSTATTRTPTAKHDYFAAVDHATGYGQFVVTCHVKHAGMRVQRTLTIYSAYALCKRAGTVVPHLTADLFAHKRYNMLSGMMTVHNVEDEAIVLDRMSVTPVQEGEVPALPRPFVTLEQSITIAPRSIAMIGVNVPFVKDNPELGQLRFDVPGFSVVYAGTSGEMPVRCSAVFDVPVGEWSKRPQPIPLPQVPPKQRKPWPWEIVEDEIAALINPADGLSPLQRAVLDVKTGTVAVQVGPLEQTGTKAAVREKGMRVLGAVYAPVERALQEARQLAIPAAEYLSMPAEHRMQKLEATEMELRRLASANVGVAKSLPGQALLKAKAPAIPAFASKAMSAPKLTTLDFHAQYHVLEGPPLPGFIAEGEVCDPENLTEEELALADEGQLVCQLTEEVKDVLMPARWMNARKGDCILSPGGDGIIGGLMLNVSPPQWYSHSGIMTRNYDEITHSTGSQKRLKDHLIGFTSDGSDGFEPSVLKYIWPGAVTQTVQRSIEGEDFPDPEYPNTYSISAFGPHTVGITHNDQMKMIPPLVLKPDPMQETPAIRTALHAIATDAKNSAGRPGVKPKYHYRWYCYTDPTIGLGAPEGPGAGWAAGTRPSVCSSFIWMMAKGRNARLESGQPLVTPTDLEPGDIAQGAAVRPKTPDGLYNYSAQERSDAAYWLYDTIYNQAFEKAGWFGVFLTDAADDIANQFLNAFANDDADGKDSEAWKTVSDADAVSPDNMMWWDGPAAGGLYGYVEPALYREPRIESYTISRWKKVLSRGTVRGRVLGANGPVAGALVQVFDGKTTFSDAAGNYRLDNVPLGNYDLTSSKVIDGVLYSAKVKIELAGADLLVDIHLQPPADRYRIAQIFIDFWGRDYETFGDDEIKDPGPEYLELELGPDKVVNSATREYRWGGEMRVEYRIVVRLLVNNAIDVQVLGKLFEGTSEDTDDEDGHGDLSFIAGVGQTMGATLTITNTEEDDDDAGVLSISVKNVRNNN